MTRFVPGQKILWQNTLANGACVAWEFVEYFDDDKMLRAKLDDYPIVTSMQSSAIISGPASAWIAAPENWRDAPQLPQDFEGRYDRLLPFTFQEDLIAYAVRDRYAVDLAEWDTEVRQPLLRRLRETGK